MATKTILITGITGQDGSYLAELLLEKGYAVMGIVRKTCNEPLWRIEHIRGQKSLLGQAFGFVCKSINLAVFPKFWGKNE